MNHSTTNTKAADTLKGGHRAGLVQERRQSGNGSVEDVADFFGISERQVRNWKDAEPPVIGHTQIGGCIWFSADDVAEVAQHHRAGKYSKVPASEVAARVRRDWLEFLGVRNAECGVRNELDELRARLDALEHQANFRQAA